MRDFGCYMYYMVDKVLTSTGGTACFASITRVLKKFNEATDGVLYIKDFEEKETKEYIDLIIEVTNEITPCKLITIDEINYIQIQMLDTYDQSLIVLNFIRNLWNEPIPEYSVKFFKALKATDISDDSLVRLTTANKVALKGNKGSHGHSNTAPEESIKIKTKQQLYDYQGYSTYGFLTN